MKQKLEDLISEMKRLLEPAKEYNIATIICFEFEDVNKMLNEAVERLNKELKTNPDNAEIHYVLGLIYFTSIYENQDDETAVKEFKKAIEINPEIGKSPDHVTLHYFLGILYKHDDKIEQAIEEYEKAVKVAPEFIGPHYALATAYFKQNKFEEATEEFKKVVDINREYEKDEIKEYLERIEEDSKFKKYIKKIIEENS